MLLQRIRAVLEGMVTVTCPKCRHEFETEKPISPHMAKELLGQVRQVGKDLEPGPTEGGIQVNVVGRSHVPEEWDSRPAPSHSYEVGGD
jgi:hypothetical protein